MVRSEYDAVLLVSFGGPERAEDVIPFLENVLRGRPIPRSRLLEVAEHYFALGGKSPINDQNRALIRLLRDELRARGPDLPVYWGNRNWHPLLPDALRAMRDDGVRRAIAFVTSAFSSYSSCRQYRENIEAARAAVGPASPRVDKIRPFFNHPGFIEAMADRVADALGSFGPRDRASAKLLFTAHSIPVSMASTSRYVEQLREASGLVADRAGAADWELVFQSRSGPPSQPWLEPDVCDRIARLPEEGVRRACVAPIGFLSEHMEVKFDLDTEAAGVAKRTGVEFVRAGAVGTHPAMVAAVRELIAERVRGGPDRASVGGFGPLPDVCPLDCCPPSTVRARRPEAAPRRQGGSAAL